MFKKGDAVYFRSGKLGTIPAIVKKVGSVPGRWAGLMLIEGNAPNNRGCINSWVRSSSCLLQTEDNYGIVHGRFGINSLDSEMVHKLECALCSEEGEITNCGQNEAVYQFYQDGWRHAVSDHYGIQGIFCPKCLKNDKEEGRHVLKIEDDHGV